MKQLKAIGCIAIFSLFLELIVFQINSFHLWGKDANYQELVLKNASITGMEANQDGSYNVLQSEASIEFKDLETNIETIYFDIEGTANTFETRIFYTDETAQYYNTEYDLVRTKMVAPEIERTKYFTCHFSRECK